MCYISRTDIFRYKLFSPLICNLMGQLFQCSHVYHNHKDVYIFCNCFRQYNVLYIFLHSGYSSTGYLTSHKERYISSQEERRSAWYRHSLRTLTREVKRRIQDVGKSSSNCFNKIVTHSMFCFENTVKEYWLLLSNSIQKYLNKTFLSWQLDYQSPGWHTLKVKTYIRRQCLETGLFYAGVNNIFRQQQLEWQTLENIRCDVES